MYSWKLWMLRVTEGKFPHKERMGETRWYEVEDNLPSKRKAGEIICPERESSIFCYKIKQEKDILKAVN